VEQYCRKSKDKHLGSISSIELFCPPNIIPQKRKMKKLTVVYIDDCTDRCQTRKPTYTTLYDKKGLTVYAEIGSVS